MRPVLQNLLNIPSGGGSGVWTSLSIGDRERGSIWTSIITKEGSLLLSSRSSQREQWWKAAYSSFSLCAPTLCGKYYPTFWETHYFIQNNGCEPCFASIIPLPAPACLLSEPLTGHLKPSISKVFIFYVAWHHQTKMIPPKKNLLARSQHVWKATGKDRQANELGFLLVIILFGARDKIQCSTTELYA